MLFRRLSAPFWQPPIWNWQTGFSPTTLGGRENANPHFFPKCTKQVNKSPRIFIFQFGETIDASLSSIHVAKVGCKAGVAACYPMRPLEPLARQWVLNPWDLQRRPGCQEVQISRSAHSWQITSRTDPIHTIRHLLERVQLHVASCRATLEPI